MLQVWGFCKAALPEKKQCTCSGKTRGFWILDCRWERPVYSIYSFWKKSTGQIPFLSWVIGSHLPHCKNKTACSKQKLRLLESYWVVSLPSLILDISWRMFNEKETFFWSLQHSQLWVRIWNHNTLMKHYYHISFQAFWGGNHPKSHSITLNKPASFFEHAVLFLGGARSYDWAGLVSNAWIFLVLAKNCSILTCSWQQISNVHDLHTQVAQVYRVVGNGNSHLMKSDPTSWPLEVSITSWLFVGPAQWGVGTSRHGAC